SGLISGSSLVPQDPASKPGVHVVARRLPDNPIISPATDPSIGTNINGPTLVKVPLWAKDPLGKYYLYFADHNGKYIRLAYSDKVEGPYKVYAPGVLPLASSYFTDHIASPEVVINEPSHQFRLYYHGLTPEERSQHTRVALSTNGRDFAAIKEPVGKGSAYWRLIKRDDWWVALAMPGKLLRSKDGITPFEIGPQLFPTSPTQVHNALLVRGNVLHVFYTRAGDKPEHILHSQVALNGDWTRWKPTDGEDVLLPETPWEGADLPLTAGIIGAVNNRIRALRDPAIFQDGGKTYLLYAIAGESGIGIAELTFD
ncbi:MAG: hypothetical protein ABJA67_02125, partial [Chthonomonadales bacterium]